jgi:hypothetical protein
MPNNGFCCGQIPKRKNENDELPENPEISSGTELIYLGSGDLKIEGESSGLNYFVSDHRRRFTVHPDDLMNLLRIPNIILRP